MECSNDSLIDRDGSVGAAWRGIAAIGLGSLVLAAALFGVSSSPLFRVRDIRVEGVLHGSPARIVRLAGVSTRDNAFWLDEAAVRRRVESDRWVAAARIDVNLPSTVTIRITERSPVATVDLGSGWLLIDAEGRAIAPGRGRGLPEVVLPPARIARGDRAAAVAGAARALASLDPTVRAQVRRVSVGIGWGLTLTLRGGARVEYGPAREIAQKAGALTQILAWVERSGSRVSRVNILAPTAPAVELGP